MEDVGAPSRSGPGLSAESLRWAIGLFCAFVGAFVLVAPHRFAGPAYLALLPYRTWWGIAALAGGVGLLGVAVLRPGRFATAIAHLLAGGTLLFLAASLSQTGIWTGFIFHLILGTGTVAAGLLAPLRPPREPAADLFALLMGAIAALSGALMVLAPRMFGPYFDAHRGLLPALGTVLVTGGSLLAVAYLRPATPRWLLWVAHLLTGAAFMSYGLIFALPRRSWTGLAASLGCGLGLALLPWLSRGLGRIDTAALRTRVALVLATATSLALVLTAAVATNQEERLAIVQVTETRQIEAQAIARNITDYVQLSAARAATIAAVASRVPPFTEAEHTFLDRTLRVYPDLEALVRLDPGGRVVASRGAIDLGAVRWREIASGAQGNNRVVLQLAHLPGKKRLRLLLCAPVVGLDNRPAGVLVGVLDGEALERRIERPGANTYLADGNGQSIASSENALAAGRGPRLPAGWDIRVLRGERPTPAGRLAAYAVVPVVGWAVAVELPRQAALAGVRRGRDLAFLLLLAVVPVAVAGGIYAARRIAQPLGTLADAVSQMTAGNPEAPLGSSDIAEVARLSAAFAEMRDRLAERTRESESLAAELRARAEVLAESDRRKDEFLAMLAHELRNPLGAIANAAYLLDQAGPLETTQQRAAAIIQRQVQHLGRLVDDLLDVSRITRGKVELRRQPLDLRDVVQNAMESSRPLIEGRQHNLQLAMPSQPLPLDGDITRLEQVAGNLLRNAAKYTDPGGEIHVSAFAVDGEAVLCVRDNGQGIAPELLPRVFDLFVQGEQGLDRTGAGLGIGLTLVRSLVEMHGGRVFVRSEGQGKGTEFEVRLPMSG